MISALMMKGPRTLIHSTHGHNQSVSLLTRLIPLSEREALVGEIELVYVCAGVCCLCSYSHSDVQNKNLGKGLSSTELHLTLYSLFSDSFFLRTPTDLFIFLLLLFHSCY